MTTARAHARMHYVAGMPQLSYTGLSENWLLKTCGDLHWQALAARAGQVVPEFRDADGNIAYAAFLAIRVRDASLEALGEHAAFDIETQLDRVAGARHLSRHLLVADRERRVDVEMMSTFIRRERERDNRSVVRAAFAHQDAHPDPVVARSAAELVTHAKRFRNGDWDQHMGLRQSLDCVRHAAEYLPCPYSDFNGADLLYFANFQSMVDRAEWGWMRFEEPPTIAQRDLFFHGNVNVGEPLELSFCSVERDNDGLAHWCEIRRTADGEKIADVVTRKRWRRR